MVSALGSLKKTEKDTYFFSLEFGEGLEDMFRFVGAKNKAGVLTVTNELLASIAGTKSGSV